jgi:hypothetical protein
MDEQIMIVIREEKQLHAGKFSFNETARLYNLENCSLHIRRRENLKSHYGESNSLSLSAIKNKEPNILITSSHTSCSPHI